MANTPEPKYTVRDFQGANIEQRSLNTQVAIANELHNIYSLLWEMREKKL